MPRYLTLFAAMVILADAAPAQDKKEPDKKKEPPPRVLYAVPLVVKAGEKQKIALRGKGLAAVKEVKAVGIEGARLKVLGGKAVPVPNNYPGERLGDSEVELEMELPKASRPGEAKLIAVGPGGDSSPYTLLLRDDLPAVVEKEPNDGFDQPQAIAVPSAVEGTIKGERDVDVFKFEGKKGEKLHIEMQAARFGSPLSPMLTLYDSGRRVLDAASETHTH